jgi:hypothetical protein
VMLRVYLQRLLSPILEIMNVHKSFLGRVMSMAGLVDGERRTVL